MNYDNYSLNELEEEYYRLKKEQKQQIICKMKQSPEYKELKRAVKRRIKELTI